ncbi:hypothetical protein CIB84_010479 [Bambusicola thoracicus]|uniref:Uncharacterized protein n=1 Tax=Bambusicola thoracicus TaxID=9083 RepID=A0A2P4SNU2_BAMTH|nr:hypothetical protein CIB84_010479 [Bambusicola thoracicus]
MFTMTLFSSWMPPPVSEKKILRRFGSGYLIWWKLLRLVLTKPASVWCDTVTGQPLSLTWESTKPVRKSKRPLEKLGIMGVIQTLEMLSGTSTLTVFPKRQAGDLVIELLKKWLSF